MNKKKITEQILDIISVAEDSIQYRYEAYIESNRILLEKNIDSMRNVFGGSWIGYHAYVYYKNFNRPKPGDHFSSEWGLMNISSNRISNSWVEYSYDEIKDTIMKDIDGDYEKRLDSISRNADIAYQNIHDRMTSLLSVLIEEKSTPLLEEIRNEVSDSRGLISSQEIIRYMSPKDQQSSRDSTATHQGYKTPPHIALEALHLSKYSPFDGLIKLIKVANKLHNYLEMQDIIDYKVSKSGSKIFIGHGQSPLWREFKDFINDRLHQDWDEFNRESAAGLATKERLQAMLDQACFAFLIMTAEDQHADKTFHARENVIHEVGLFQAKLGFRRAIVLLEEGCSEFSNIIGVSQIRFPRGNIDSTFEEVRKVLEREGVLKK